MESQSDTWSGDIDSQGEPENEMGSHEEFDFELAQKYEIERLKDELKNVKCFQSHLLWHCMMYRKALKQIPSGCKALEQTLLEFKKKPSAFYTCACCESEASEVKLRDLHKNANQTSYKKPEMAAQKDDTECSACTNDKLLLQISKFEKP